MSCTPVRIDNQDFNNTTQVDPAYPVYDATRGKVYFVYTDLQTSRNPTDSGNRAVVFRELDVATEVLASPVIIEEIPHGATEDTDNIDYAQLIRLTSGTLICAYFYTALADGLALRAHVKESTDNGLNWSASVNIDSTIFRLFMSLATDGVNVWAFTYQQGGGATGQQLYAWKRTGIGTWDAGTMVYDGHVGGSASAELTWQLRGGKHHVIVVSSLICVIIVERLTSGTTQAVTCFRTVDSGATWAEVQIKDCGTDVRLHNPISHLGTDGRIRTMWLENNAAYVSCAKPVFAYSDDNGATWSVIGTPALMSINDTNAWKPQQKTMILGANNEIIVGTWTKPASSWTIVVWSGGESLTGWSEIKRCDIGAVVNSNLVGTAVMAGTKMFQVLDPVVAGPFYEIAYLSEAVPPGGGGTELITESPSGTDQPNMYLRLDIADDRGWSAHQTAVTCFVPWPEGDYTTERRKHEVLGAVSSIDANIQDVAILPAYWKMDDPERWGKEALVNNADATYTYIDDPFLFIWRSENLNLGESGSQNIVRGVYLKYRRPSQETFDVQVWIDGVIADVQTIPGALGPEDEPAEFWWPIPRSTNVGSLVQLRIEDRERIDLKIEEFTIKFRPKHWRMRG